MKTSKIHPVRLCLLLILSYWIASFGSGFIFMKEIKLTKGFVTTVDDEDYENLIKWKWYVHGNHPHLYAYRSEYIKGGGGKKQGYSMHRVIMNVTNPNLKVDHRDFNGLNNQKSNLRVCTVSQNNANTKPRKNSLSKYLGVSLFKKTKNSKGKWRATIGKNKKIYHIGYFKTQEDAALAYNERAIQLHGEFANLNVVSNG